MDGYTLIGIDQMEASIVRRHLYRWSDEKIPPLIAALQKETITPLIAALQQVGSLSRVHIWEPRWETNVYPLYYYCVCRHKDNHKEVYKRVLNLAPGPIPSDLQKYVERAADTEIDLLVEDREYFVFIEVKIPADDRKVKFEKTGGVHQLIRQYVQGKILERVIGNKTFALATIGANHGQTIELRLNDTERALLRAVEEDKQLLAIPDLQWGLLDTLRDVAGTS